MNTHRKATIAFTLIELIVVLGVIVLLAGVLIPNAMKARQKAQRITCVSHMKQIGLSFRLWSGDSEAYFPMARSTNDQGTLEVSNEVWRTFQVMSNELSTPFILACPSDSRDTADDFSSLSNSNISYFIGLDAEETMPELLLAGDRHLSTGRPTQNKILTIQTNDTAAWVGRTHQGQGNVVLADGSAQQFTSARLHQAVTNLFQIYRRERTNATLRIAMP